MTNQTQYSTLLYRNFSEEIKSSGFSGDIDFNYAKRIISSTDNSIYQVVPEGIIYPKSTEDLSILLKTSNKDLYKNIIVVARGGGTGTNGQSLTSGFIIDTSRYMDNIIEINIKEQWAKVQCGVIKDYLNDQLKKNNLFFSPELSTSNRATIGGMVNTDASGQGSIVYGKTHHHVLELTSVLSDGTIWHSKPIDEDKLSSLCQQKNMVGNIHRVTCQAFDENKKNIEKIFTGLPRGLTGYNLANIRDKKTKKFNLNSVLCGSEGTLAIISEIKINLSKKPKKSALVLVFYPNFQTSLKDVKKLIKSHPSSIETIDSRILNLAKKNNIWSNIKYYFPENTDKIDGINFVEFEEETNKNIEGNIKKFTELLKTTKESLHIGYKVITNAVDIQKIWEMRKLSVGLLGNMDGEKKPIAFVEDVAVPPENLAEFIKQFRTILDKHQLSYGMFGHVDVGVLHVRPAIDMKDPQQAKLIRIISDQIAVLAKRYGGVLWGEHGKGFRSEYAPKFFDKLYPVLQSIKYAFDPKNQLNPGKIATPSNMPLFKIDEIQTRGQLDSTINKHLFKIFNKGMYCNGNGACFNYQTDQQMCPTFKATKNRIHSPKGRAMLVKEWIRIESSKKSNLISTIIHQTVQPFWKVFFKKSFNTILSLFQPQSLEKEVYQALNACMSCKACVGQCPIQINVPDLRSKFFQIYHFRYLRPLKHTVASWLEFAIPLLAILNPIYNYFIKSKWGNFILKKTIGLQDLPSIKSSNPIMDAKKFGAIEANINWIKNLTNQQIKKTIIIVQDAYTSFFDTPLLMDTINFIQSIGYYPLITKYQPNGKALHVYGYLNQFHRTAKKNIQYLHSLSSSGITFVGLDASVILTYRDEYKETLEPNIPKINLLSEWLISQLKHINYSFFQKTKQNYTLLAHCTEATNEPSSITHWQKIFSEFGLTLNYQPTGCCGMAGIYGHETCNQKISKKLYSLSWKNHVENIENKEKLVATGFSCRCQINRLSDKKIPHPIQILSKITTTN